MKVKSISLNFILFCVGFFLQALVFSEKSSDNSFVEGILIAKKTTEESQSDIKRDTSFNENTALAKGSSSKLDESKGINNKSIKPEELLESSRETDLENQSHTSSVEKKDKAVGKQADKKKEKRKVAGEEQAYECSEFWTDEFSYGYIQVGSKCSAESNVCFAFFQIHRNYCEESNLIRYYCDPKKPSLVSTETIECKKSCEFSGLSGTCVK